MTRVRPLVDEMADAGFRVSEIIMDGRVANITARWLNGAPGEIIVIDDYDNSRREAEILAAALAAQEAV